MILIIIAIVIGTGVGLLVPYTIPNEYVEYVAIALLGCFDTIFGGIYADFDRNFKLNLFLLGFFLNSVLACGIVLIGNLLGLELVLAMIVVYGTKIFNNFSKIRQKLLQKYENKCKIKSMKNINYKRDLNI